MPGPKPTCICGDCKKCRQRAASQRWRKKTPEKQQEYRDQRKDYIRDYSRRNRDRLNAQMLALYHEAEDKEKYRARGRLNDAIRKGKLTREPCEVCGVEPTEGHHDDYSKPLEVRWLCRAHHAQHHAQERQQEAA